MIYTKVYMKSIYKEKHITEKIKLYPSLQERLFRPRLWGPLLQTVQLKNILRRTVISILMNFKFNSSPEAIFRASLQVNLTYNWFRYLRPRKVVSLILVSWFPSKFLDKQKNDQLYLLIWEFNFGKNNLRNKRALRKSLFGQTRYSH